MYLLWRNIEVYIFSFIIVIKIQTRYNDIDVFCKYKLPKNAEALPKSCISSPEPVKSSRGMSLQTYFG